MIYYTVIGTDKSQYNAKILIGDKGGAFALRSILFDSKKLIPKITVKKNGQAEITFKKQEI